MAESKGEGKESKKKKMASEKVEEKIETKGEEVQQKPKQPEPSVASSSLFGNVATYLKKVEMHVYAILLVVILSYIVGVVVNEPMGGFQFALFGFNTMYGIIFMMILFLMFIILGMEVAKLGADFITSVATGGFVGILSGICGLAMIILFILIGVPPLGAYNSALSNPLLFVSLAIMGIVIEWAIAAIASALGAATKIWLELE